MAPPQPETVIKPKAPTMRGTYDGGAAPAEEEEEEEEEASGGMDMKMAMMMSMMDGGRAPSNGDASAGITTVGSNPHPYPYPYPYPDPDPDPNPNPNHRCRVPRSTSLATRTAPTARPKCYEAPTALQGLSATRGANRTATARPKWGTVPGSNCEAD